MISLDDILSEFINPPEPEKIKKRNLRDKNVLKADLLEKRDKGQAVVDLTKTYVWREIIRKNLVNELRRGMGTLIRDGMNLNEIDLKKTISELRASITLIADLQYIVNEGVSASEKLGRMK